MTTERLIQIAVVRADMAICAALRVLGIAALVACGCVVIAVIGHCQKRMRG